MYACIFIYIMNTVLSYGNNIHKIFFAMPWSQGSLQQFSRSHNYATATLYIYQLLKPAGKCQNQQKEILRCLRTEKKLHSCTSEKRFGIITWFFVVKKFHDIPHYSRRKKGLRYSDQLEYLPPLKRNNKNNQDFPSLVTRPNKAEDNSNDKSIWKSTFFKILCLTHWTFKTLFYNPHKTHSVALRLKTWTEMMKTSIKDLHPHLPTHKIYKKKKYLKHEKQMQNWMKIACVSGERTYWQLQTNYKIKIIGSDYRKQIGGITI